MLRPARHVHNFNPRRSIENRQRPWSDKTYNIGLFLFCKAKIVLRDGATSAMSVQFGDKAVRCEIGGSRVCVLPFYRLIF